MREDIQHGWNNHIQDLVAKEVHIDSTDIPLLRRTLYIVGFILLAFDFGLLVVISLFLPWWICVPVGGYLGYRLEGIYQALKYTYRYYTKMESDGNR